MNDQTERLIASQIELTQAIHELVNAVALLIEQADDPEDEDMQPAGVYLMDGTRVS